MWDMKDYEELTNMVKDHEERIEDLENPALSDNEIEQNKKIAELEATAKEINLIIHGSDRLGIPPLLYQVKEIYKTYDRMKWAAGTLGVTNVGIIITWLITALGRSL